MKYIIKGTFNTGDEWSETANNKSELEYIVHKVLQNECVAYYEVYVKKGKEVVPYDGFRII